MKKSLKANAVLSMLKTIMSLITPIITFPYVSRILQVEALGKYNFSLSIVSYFILLAELGINTYAIREGAKIRNNRDEFENFANEITSINIFSMIISYFLLFLFVISLDKISNYALLIFILSIQIALNTFGRTWIYNVYEDFIILTITQCAMQIFSVILLFLFVHSPQDIYIYAMIYIISSAFANLFFGIYSKKYVKFRLRISINILKKHISPVLIIFCTTLASTLYVNSDVTLLGWLINDECVGLYSTAVKIYSIVKQVIIALITVAIPRLTLYTGTEEFKTLFEKVFRVLISFIFPAMVGLFMMSKETILIIAGPEYLGATISLQILSISLLFSLLACLFGTGVLIPYNEEKYFLKATLISAFINVILNLFLIPMFKQDAAAFTTLIAEIVIFFLCLLQSKKYIGKISIKSMYPIFMGCISIVVYCMIVKFFKFSLVYEVCFCVLGSLILYSIVQILFKNEQYIFIISWTINMVKKLF